MSIVQTPSSSVVDLVDELRSWLEENWNPELTVAQWWGLLGLAGWSAPMLPPASYGRGLGRLDALRVHAAIADFGALGPPQGLGLALAAPTIVSYGTSDQIDRFVRDIVTGQRGWCQLFSEPGAGSDLAGLATRAVRDGDVWIVNGQKVWTSGGQFSDFGMLLARTNPDAPKHQGITWFAFDMRQSGVEVRPLREMTGSSLFCEVFLTDAEVRDDARIGEVNDGWRVANSTLLFERSGMGEGAGAPMRGVLLARAGTIAGDLERRAGDFVVPAATRPHGPESSAKPTSPAGTYIQLARSYARNGDAAIRQDLARLHILGEIVRLNTERNKAARAAGADIPGIANFSKLAMGNIHRLQRDLGLTILGARGMLHAYDEAEREALNYEGGGSPAPAITGQALLAQALPIYGGTDQIQRNIISERTLGLPKEPGDLSHLPFSQLPRNG